jgi:hypothetical protein
MFCIFIRQFIKILREVSLFCFAMFHCFVVPWIIQMALVLVGIMILWVVVELLGFN